MAKVKKKKHAYGLGRKPAPDARDTRFLLQQHMPSQVQRPQSINWGCDWRGDQGSTSTCVGQAWYGLLQAKPIVRTYGTPQQIYDEAQAHDEWPGTNYDGTSVRGGAKALKLDRELTRYGWAFDLETCLNWIGIRSPMVWGVSWYDKMFSPASDGLVTVGGSVVGGHAFLVRGYDDMTRRVFCQNSWGDWGVNGCFYLSYDDATRLLGEQGEACSPTERILA